MGMIYKRGSTWWLKYCGKASLPKINKVHQGAHAKGQLKKREGKIREGKLPGVYYDKVYFDELAHEDYYKK
jgi:hypothetical protein